MLSYAAGPWVVVVGNPFDGMTCWGPFQSYEQASAYAEKCEGDWWIVDIHRPGQ